MRCWSCTAAFQGVAPTEFLQLKLEPDAITAIFSFFFGINIPNAEQGYCPGTYIQIVSVTDKEHKVKLPLHLLSYQQIALTGFSPCFDSLPSDGLQSTPGSYSKFYALCVCAITGY